MASRRDIGVLRAVREERDRLAKEKRDLLAMIWALVKLRGGTVTVPELLAMEAVDERNRLAIVRDPVGNVVLGATRVEAN